jgi:hypothetical protein
MSVFLGLVEQQSGKDKQVRSETMRIRVAVVEQRGRQGVSNSNAFNGRGGPLAPSSGVRRMSAKNSAAAAPAM